MVDFPQNVLPWAIGSVIIAFFGVRALLNYKRVRSPLSKYFALATIPGSIGLALWSLPFLIIDVNSHRLIMVMIIGLGDVLVYFSLISLASIFWHLHLQKWISFSIYIIPVTIIALVGFVAGVHSAIAGDLPKIVNSNVIYPTSALGDMAQTILLLISSLVGASMILQAHRQKIMQVKLGSYGIAIMILGISIGGLFNVNGNTDSGSNLSPIFILSYGLWIVIFVAIVFFLKVVDRKK